MQLNGNPGAPRMRLLLDSNVIIAAEPFAGDLEENLEVAALLLRLANEQGHYLCVAAATRDDLLQGQDATRRRQRLAELAKFSQLAEVPVSDDLRERAGDSPRGSNDERDLRILAALDAGAATHLVSDDARLLRRAAKAGLGELALTTRDACDLLRGFAPEELAPPPRVTSPPAYALNRQDPIFDGLRADYPGFDEWLAKVARESDWDCCTVR